MVSSESVRVIMEVRNRQFRIVYVIMLTIGVFSPSIP